MVGQYVNTDYRDLGANSAGEVPGANTASKKVGAKFVAGRAFASMAGCAADALIAKLQMTLREAEKGLPYGGKSGGGGGGGKSSAVTYRDERGTKGEESCREHSE